MKVPRLISMRSPGLLNVIVVVIVSVGIAPRKIDASDKSARGVSMLGVAPISAKMLPFASSMVLAVIVIALVPVRSRIALVVVDRIVFFSRVMVSAVSETGPTPASIVIPLEPGVVINSSPAMVKSLFTLSWVASLFKYRAPTVVGTTMSMVLPVWPVNTTSSAASGVPKGQMPGVFQLPAAVVVGLGASDVFTVVVKVSVVSAWLIETMLYPLG